MAEENGTEYIVLEDIDLGDMVVPAGRIYMFDPVKDQFEFKSVSEEIGDKVESKEETIEVISGDILRPHMTKMKSVGELVAEVTKELADEELDTKFDEILTGTVPEGRDEDEQSVPDTETDEGEVPSGEESSEEGNKLYTFDIVQTCSNGDRVVLQHFEDVEYNGVSIVITAQTPLVFECPNGDRLTVSIEETSHLAEKIADIEPAPSEPLKGGDSDTSGELPCDDEVEKAVEDAD